MPIHVRALSLLLLIPPTLVAQAPRTPGLDQILARHIEARGGLAKIKAIQSLKSVGRIELGPMVLNLTIENPRGAFRSDTSLQGMTKTEAFDGRNGWVIDPFAGSMTVVPMSPDQLRTVELQGDFDGPLVDSRAKGHKVTFAGMQVVNGVETYALKVSMKHGDELVSFIDAKTFMEIKATHKVVSTEKVVEIETTFGDYRPVNGVMMPFSLDMRSKGQSERLKIHFDKVDANLPMDDARFKMPASKTALAKE